MSDLFEQVTTFSTKEYGNFEAFLLESGSEFNAFPLSFAQQRLWFLDQFEPDSPLYNIPAAVRIEGALDAAALEESIREIVRRHEALQTTFATVGGHPVQVITPELEIDLPVIDLDNLAQGEREDRVRELAIEVARQPFDLTRGPLLRVKLLRLSDVEHVLILILHHIVADGWSLGVFIHELSVFYRAFVTKASAHLPDLPIQYADFAVWQREWLQDEVLEEQLAHWRERLGGELPVLQLPTDRPRPSIQTFEGARHPIALSETLTAALQALSQREGVTLFITMLAAFKVLLYRYTGQNDVLVGSPIANRTEGETKDLIGFFVNTLVLCTDLVGNPTFRDLLRRVRETAVGAYEHQDMPFEKLVEELQPGRDMSHAPLFQVMFSLQNALMPPIELADLSLTLVEIDSGTAKFDLTLDLTETAEGVRGWFEYNTDLFEVATIARMGEHLQTLLKGIVANPDLRLADLPLLTDAERHRLLVGWNDTQADYSRDTCIHELFEAQVERTPDAVAVVFEDQYLTYCELNRRSNQLARYLQKLGVEPELRVGVCVERSSEMVIAILAALKVGGVYVPLDPAYPEKRLAFILADAQAPVLLTESRLLPLISALESLVSRVVYVDSDRETIARERGENLLVKTASVNLAYLIYTSGSTGRPKGVAIEHRSAVSMLSWSKECFAAKDRAGMLASTSICFDLSVFELFVPLSWGGMIVLTENALQLPTLPAAEAVTLINTVPSAMAELVRTDGIPASVRTVNLAGEALQSRLVQQIYRRDHVERVLNLYGPSEDTTYSTFSLIGRQSRQSPPIGRPVANSQVYVLGPWGEAVPVGVPGELCIGGDGLARGYLDRPGPTAERFIPNPFSDEPGARLYRTGDQVRYLPDGELEFLGRVDHQVKIRGFRIELGEVETALRGHPAVEETVVLAWGDVPGEQRLVAYVVGQDGAGATGQISPPTTSDLRAFLKEQLPDYMVPSTFVSLDALPLTPNGKVDRRALPAPDAARPELEGVFVAPRTPVEEMLAGQWAQLLGVEQVGIHDNFFDLGGHSLLATRLVSRLRETFPVELPVRSLFEASTVAELAAYIETARQDAPGQQMPPVLPISRQGDVALSFAQQRLWLLDRFGEQTAAYAISGASRLTGRLDVAALEQSLNEVVRRHEVLRTTFVESGGRPVQVISAALHVPVPVLDLQGLPEAEREIEAHRLMTAEARRPFDLARDALVRVMLLHLADEVSILALNVHHIVADGWSMGVLIREIAAHYDALVNGKTVSLSALPIQYADFASWQRDWLQGKVLKELLTYWRGHLDNLHPVELPIDCPRPPVQTHRGAAQEISVPKALTEALRTLSRREGVTLFMTLLAAFKTLLYRYTGQVDVTVGSPIANRSTEETEALIGFFANTLVLRTDLAGDPTFRELLHRVREMALEAYVYQDIPFEKLVEELEPERDMSRTPLFQVMFALQNVPTPTIELSGLSLSFIEIDNRTAKFDLTLDLTETPDGLRGRFRYNTDLFEAATIARMAEHLQILLGGIAASPDRRIAELPILAEAKRDQMLVGWNDTASDYPRDRCIHEMFKAQVNQSPDAVAVIFEEKHLTYRELDLRAKQLAHHLQELGVGPEVLVGIYMERSLEMMIGLMGILKAGGAFVPLDPTDPQGRIAFILEDAQVSVLLTQEHLVERLPTDQTTDSSAQSRRAVCLDSDWMGIAQAREENLVSGVMPDNLAYVIYTSGSTGQPKGVGITHHSLMNYLCWFNETLLACVMSNLPVTSQLTFDASLKQLFAPFLDGREVWLLPNDIVVQPDALFRSLGTRAKVGFNCVPSLWKTMLDFIASPHGETLGAPVDCLLIGGEAFDQSLLERSWALWPDLQVWNLYGPTEATANASAARMTCGDRVTIGHPIANTQFYILDRNWQPVPVGVPGELYISGTGLARGYLYRPRLTAERFIPNPFTVPVSPDGKDGKGGSRLYRTGDLARYLPDGSVEFLGRIDHQVKVRGYRIELGEIEATLGEHPGVQETAALMWDGSGDEWLVAYVVPKQGATPDTSALRSFLTERLPAYMIPSAFVTLEALPLTSSKKVDRRALPPPDWGRPKDAGTFVGPRTSIEEELVNIWNQVLNVDMIGVHDNFFVLGGHSLVAVWVLSRVREVFHVDISMLSLFEEPTIANLASKIVQTQGPQVDDQISALESEQDEAMQMLEDLVMLSDEEVDALLEDLLLAQEDGE